MRLFGIIPAVIVVMVLIVMSAGCINNTSGNQQVTTPTPAAAAVDLHMKGFNAYLKGNYTTALEFFDQSIAADPKYARAWMDKEISSLSLTGLKTQYQPIIRRLQLTTISLWSGTAGEKP